MDPSLPTDCLGPTEASWSDLPAPLAERILRQAFQDSSRSLLQRLRMSLVCKYGFGPRAPLQPCVQLQQAARHDCWCKSMSVGASPAAQWASVLNSDADNVRGTIHGLFLARALLAVQRDPISLMT